MSLATVTLFAQYVGRHEKILTVRHGTTGTGTGNKALGAARLPSLPVHAYARVFCTT